MKIQSYKNGKESITFNSKSEAINHFNKWGTYDDQDCNNEISLNEDNLMFSFYDNDGDEWICKEEELSFADQITEMLEGMNFSKSTNNSWYFNNGETSIRISDHSRVYETAQLNHFDFVVNSIEEMDTIIDEINEMPIF